MIGLDTNIVVRLLVEDDVEQHQISRMVVASGPVFVSLAVLMETEWVLRKAYGFAKSDIAAALRAFAGLNNVTVEDPSALRRILELFATGFDFADAVHVVQASHADRFATFDRDLERLAAKVAGGVEVFIPDMEHRP